MTVPIWRRTAALGEISAEVCVVGGGIAGISAAMFLQDAGVPVVLVERGAIGSGASSRNAGYLMRGAADNYSLAVEQYGRGTAAMLWRWTEENLALLLRRGIERVPSFSRRASCLLALEAGELGELRKSVDMLREDGFDAGWLNSHDDAAWRSGRALGGLLNPHDGVINPVELLGLLRSQLRCPVLEHQEVAEVVSEGGGVRLRLTDGMVRCRRALVCLNAYAPLLMPWFVSRVRPNRGQMLALEAPSGVLRLDYSYYANRGSEYFRRADENTVVVGGKRKTHEAEERTYDDGNTPGVQGELERFAECLFGVLPPVKARWAGTMGFTPDHLPLIGPVPGYEGGVWFCGGFTGHGMSLGHRCARAAVEAMLAGDPSVLGPFALSRFSAGA